MIIIDGVGCGELPDAAKYGDAGSNTLGNLAQRLGGMNLPNLQKLGLGNILPLKGIPPSISPMGNYGKMAEKSPGKDSTAGHWELMGYPIVRPFPLFPSGFPEGIVRRLESESGRRFIGNKTASGTEIIQELGAEHLKSGALILYTSADSVLQIAAHEEKIPLAELYEICRTARKIMTGEHAVARIIARPFLGQPEDFRRTPNRRDFSLRPPRKTTLDYLSEAGISVTGIGKIFDLFGGRGVQRRRPTHSNREGIEQTIEISHRSRKGFIFTNLVDFDMLWGHRNDPEGFYQGLSEFDQSLPAIMATLGINDILMITADHGVDPTTVSTDHSREYVPLLVWGESLRRGVDLGIRGSFADVGASVMDFFNIDATLAGNSFLPKIIQ